MSLGTEDFIMPEEPLEQEHFKRQLISTARSLKKRSNNFKLIKICSMINGPMSWQPRNTASSAQPKVTRSVNCYPNLTTRPSSPHHQHVMRLTDHLVARTKRQLKPNTSPYYLAVKVETQQLGNIHMTYGRTWKIEQVRPDRSTVARMFLDMR